MKQGYFITNYGWNSIERAYPTSLQKKMQTEINIPAVCLNEKLLEQAPEQFQEADVLFSTWGMPLLSEKQIDCYFPNLKAVFYAAGSVQQFVRPFFNRGVRVFCAASANAVPVAEYTLAQILLANKGYFQASRKIRDRSAAHAFANSFPGNMRCKVGIIGAGAIGKLVIKMLGSFSLEILVFDPFLPDEAAKELGVRKTSLEEVFAECQTISNHLANNEKTKGMLDYSLFSRMKENATFINTGRGAQVKEEDLCRALEECPNRTALLDVTLPEPPAQDSKLFTLENIVITPHIAGSISNEIGRMGEYMFQAYRNYSCQCPSQCEVTMEMLETMA